jgi:hypothetical protein
MERRPCTLEGMGMRDFWLEFIVIINYLLAAGIKGMYSIRRSHHGF